MTMSHKKTGCKGDLTCARYVSDHRNAGSPKGGNTYGDGLPIVLDVRESRIYGEGAEEMFIPMKRKRSM